MTRSSRFGLPLNPRCLATRYLGVTHACGLPTRRKRPKAMAAILHVLPLLYHSKPKGRPSPLMLRHQVSALNNNTHVEGRSLHIHTPSLPTECRHQAHSRPHHMLRRGHATATPPPCPNRCMSHSHTSGTGHLLSSLIQLHQIRYCRVLGRTCSDAEIVSAHSAPVPLQLGLICNIGP